MAKAGLLDGMEATTHHGAIELLRQTASKTTVYAHRTNTMVSQSDAYEPKPVDYDYTLSAEGLSAQLDHSYHDPFKPLGYVPNMTYDTGDPTPIDLSSTLGSADTPPDEE